MQSTQTIISTVAADPVTLWEKLAAASGVLLAIFAAVQLELARRHRNADDKRAAQERADRQAAADARVSPRAFALRRELFTWMGADERGDFFDWVKWVSPRLDIAEARFQEVLAEVDASPTRRAALHEALVRLYRVKAVIAECSGKSPGHEQLRILLKYNQQFPNVDPDLWACMDLLSKAMESELSEAEKRLLVEEAP